MKTRRRPRRQQRGFALFIIVLIVALVAVTAGTLLDMVNVDLIISGEHRKAATANAVAVGGAMEMMADDNLTPLGLPLSPTDPTIAFVYATDTGVPTRDPGSRTGLPGLPASMDETNSSFTRNVGTNIQESYTADARLIRLGPPLDSSVNQSTAVFYEVRSVSNINNGAATKEVRAEIYRIAPGTVGRILETATNIYAR